VRVRERQLVRTGLAAAAGGRRRPGGDHAAAAPHRAAPADRELPDVPHLVNGCVKARKKVGKKRFLR